MLTIATCLWDANEKTPPNSRCFDETWVDKLFRGFKRNLTLPFRFVCFVDRPREFSEPIQQMKLARDPPDFGCLIEPFGIGGPLLVAGLDTIIVGNVDELARYCHHGTRVALPRDPYQPERSINAIALVPPGWTNIRTEWRGENDMEWLRRHPWQPIDDLWPGQVLSLKFHQVRTRGLQGARIVYFHGRPKPHELSAFQFVREHWR